ncbi:TPP-dependent pyruvate/acetoin dehydrogenase alpha subunit [Altererythrobacter atlanticus]|uniref:Acetoin:2,6-dichlorophenolindophenol oxidoreductase subunit alpha n=1 Tax=Croceibacterium atlanticum TaxID=1267766 RepID=A0A0F7KUI3_9SPHN|nr:thiamine pyrophosphate-dependent dehydrogenase E1 component subunit alpha [Croceibacterium atlanticum]AKH42846.1 Acetoin:2,6-dichlorophenolindophenol oxidoreductase subunit alpha [Croceibacterium atlanticum]MBB5731626.1 TPP-dependent pyruvate/acetoin dehydrogenase alpha subunit [Croceibacterium atlanticum]
MKHFNDLLSSASNDQATSDYMTMSFIRQFEQRLLDMFSQGLMAGTTHTCIGQEANAVAIMGALDREIDTVWSNHRCHGHFLAYCGDAYRLFAEILGRETGVCAGRGGSQHLAWRNFFSSGIQGGLVPLAVGTAHADKEIGAITTVFLGDGTMGQGYVYEGMNLAALWNCPVLFVVEDNGIAQTTRRTAGVAGEIGQRGAPFGIRSRTINSTDIEELREAAIEAADYVRTEGKPFWLHIETVRLHAHSKGDDTRPEEELRELRKRDCLDIARNRVSGETDALDEIVRAYLDQCFETAMADPEACA